MLLVNFDLKFKSTSKISWTGTYRTNRTYQNSFFKKYSKINFSRAFVWCINYYVWMKKKIWPKFARVGTLTKKYQKNHFFVDALQFINHSKHLSS
jgi:hypothetical protein